MRLEIINSYHGGWAAVCVDLAK